MEILPGETSSATPGSGIFDKIKKTLQDPQSLLRTGPVGGMLASGELSLGRKPTAKDAKDQKAHEGHEGNAKGMVPNVTLLLLLTSLWYSVI